MCCQVNLKNIKTTSRTSLLALLAAALLGCASVSARGPEARVAIERAVRYIELGDFALARSHLELPLIDGRITNTEVTFQAAIQWCAAHVFD